MLNIDNNFVSADIILVSSQQNLKRMTTYGSWHIWSRPSPWGKVYSYVSCWCIVVSVKIYIYDRKKMLRFAAEVAIFTISNYCSLCRRCVKYNKFYENTNWMSIIFWCINRRYCSFLLPIKRHHKLHPLLTFIQTTIINLNWFLF